MKTSLNAATFLLIVLLFFSHYSFAARYYFSTSSGDDSRTAAQAQNPSTPWKSINKLNAIFHTLKPGDEVLFERGEVFYGSVHMNKSGANGNPIVLGAYGSGPKPVITSLVRLDNWKAIGNGVYESSHPSFKKEVEIVLLNGVIQELGRFPNNDGSNESYAFISSAQGNGSITSNDLPSANFSGGEVVIRKNQWIIDRHKILNHSGNRINYLGIGEYTPSKNFGFFIQKHIKTLDKEGEWYYDSSKKKLNVFFGSDPGSRTVEASTLDHLLTKSYGASYISINNLHFKGSNKDAIHISGGRGIAIENTEVEFSGENGIASMSILDLVINNNRINHSFNNGIYLRYGNNGAKITNNVVENTFVFPGSSQNGDNNGIGIYAISDNSLIEYNQIKNTGYSGIYFGGNSTVIKNNLIDFYCTIKNDGGGIYSYVGRGNQRFRDRKIIGNIILNGVGSRNGIPDAAITSKGQAQGIFLDDNTNGVEVLKNTIADANHSGIKISNSRDIVFKENLVYNSYSQVLIGNGGNGDDSRNIKVSDNILFSKYSDQYSYTIKTNKNDLAQVGDFNNNYLYRPLGDAYSIMLGYMDNRKQVEKIIDLKGWQKSFNKDRNSSVHPQLLKAFEVKKLIGPSVFDNSGLDRSVSGLVCNGCNLSWATGKLNGGSAKVETRDNSALATVVGEVLQDKNYILKFNATSNKAGALRVYLRHSGSPWQVVSPSTTVELSPDKKEYTILLKPYADIERSALMIHSEEGNWTYWIDDIEFKEAEVDVYKPQDKFLFEYNATKSSKSIALNGTFVDVKNKEVSGTITLEPFSSIVLIRTSDVTPSKPVAPTVKIASPVDNFEVREGQKVEIKVNASAPGGKVQKVEFYNGNALLGSSSTPPYSFEWDKVPAGKQTITAKVIDNNSQTATSSPLTINVEKLKELENDPIDGKDRGDVADVTGVMNYNIGSSSSLTYNGETFLPITEVNVNKERYSVGTNPAASSESLFQNSNFGSRLSYTIEVPNGVYTVKTYHIEEYFGHNGISASSGQRVFDVLLENKRVKKDFDMYVESDNKETILTFKNIEVKDGKLDVELIASRNNAIISGISISKNTDIIQKPGQQENLGKLDNAILINVGSTSDVKHNGDTFISDYRTRYFDGNSNIASRRDLNVDPLFRSHRFAKELSYTIPVPNGTYTVITYHYETYFGGDVPLTGSRKRVFDLVLEGKRVKKDLDLYRENKNAPLALRFDNIEVVDGKLNLEMIASVNNALLSGIAIISHSDKNKIGSANQRLAFEEPQVVEDNVTAVAMVSGNDSGRFSLYPNPAREKVSLKIGRDLGSFSILVHNMNGQLIDHHDSADLVSGSGEFIIPTNHLQQGVYNITLAGEREILDRLKLIVSP